MTAANLTINEMWDTLLEFGVSEQTLQVVTDINGYNEQSMKSILYSVARFPWYIEKSALYIIRWLDSIVIKST